MFILEKTCFYCKTVIVKPELFRLDCLCFVCKNCLERKLDKDNNKVFLKNKYEKSN